MPKRFTKVLAPNALNHRTSTPLMAWIRAKLLCIDRDPKTPPPGPPTADGKARYMAHNRFPSTQSAKDQLPPDVPGGIHHRLADNYYYERDARRTIEPPKPLYQAGQEAPQITSGQVAAEVPASQQAHPVRVIRGVVKGPDQNYGLPSMPTPGFGYQWNRTIGEEMATQKKDPNLRFMEQFDRFSSQTS
ncbi:NADH:ubiquinone oxidoreductase subunit b14.5a (Complex i-B14.5a) domain-containing protein [Ditylenchus destructor]|uniref:NADH dehydrogenase [ubiquinone] 1 alpha subcomplex subunit 7 n=1 Tax=Ditylenchus destructor TaxID=166010 RepID=A0AAD4R6R2_9BILA|nr:NADH:ubiquinone oxidoreductase subunit b14.5a (Complex i-B14.5a) domain-containing protein [Ditylenchus destructor]